jgi:nucleoid-associated protein YgaU
MENTRGQQAAADGLVAGTVLALGAVLVAAGSSLARDLAPGASGGWLRIAPAAFDAVPTLDVLLGLIASLTGLAVVAWWLLSMGLAIVSALLAAAGARTASRRAGSFAPAFMRRLALAMLGLSLVAVPAAQADSLPDPAWHPAAAGPAAASTQRAAPPPTPIASAHASVAAPSLAAPLGAAPSAAASPSAASSAIAPSAAPAPVPEAGWVPVAPPTDPGLLVQQPLREPVRAGEVEVRPGDSLWTIVARHLGPGATDLDIAAAWPSWYEANAGTIGADPDLIRPGQLLVPPR